MSDHRRCAVGAAVLCCVLAALLLAASVAEALTPAGNGWYWQNPHPMRVGEVEDVMFADADTIYAPGMGHGLGRSADGGATWQLVTLPAGAESLCFSAELDGWALGGRYYGEQSLWHTVDGGATWAETKVPGTMAMRTIDFVSPTEGYAIGWPIDPPASYDGPASFFWTTDGGASWQSRRLPIDAVGQRLEFIDAQHGWIAVGDGRVGATSDGGQTWTYVQTPAAGDFYAEDIHLQFLDADDGVVYFGVDDPGYDDTIAAAVTHDGGASWSEVELPGVTPAGVAMVDPGHLVALGMDQRAITGVCATSADGGSTWQRRPLGQVPWRWRVAGGPSGTICAVGPASILTSADAGATWRAHASGYIGTLVDVASVDEEAWAVGTVFDADSPVIFDMFEAILSGWDWRPDAGLLLHTTDGVTWREEALPGGVTFSAVAFASHGNGWALSSQGWDSMGDADAIRGTSDGGATWAPLYLSGQSFTDLCATDEDHAWALTATTVVQTTDGGATWHETPIGGEAEFARIAFVDDLRGWIAGDTGDGEVRVLGTTDGGQTWTRESLPETSGWVAALSFLDADHGWVLVERDEWTRQLLRTSDGGVTWESLDLPEGVTLHDLRFSSAVEGVGVGDSVYGTIDGGATWQDLTIGTAGGADEGDLYAVAGAAGARLWAVGGGGSILSTVDTAADTAPPRTFDDFDRDWHNEPVSVTLTANDIGGSGLARTEFHVDGETGWRVGSGYTFGAPASGIGDGIHYLTYRSVDAAGNAESATTRRVAIDTREPRFTRLRVTPRVLRGRRVVVSYRIADALSPRATMRFVVRDRSWRVVKRLPLCEVKIGVVRKASFIAPRRLGTYYLSPDIWDLAGNRGWGYAEFRVVKRVTARAASGNDARSPAVGDSGAVPIAAPGWSLPAAALTAP